MKMMMMRNLKILTNFAKGVLIRSSTTSKLNSQLTRTLTTTSYEQISKTSNRRVEYPSFTMMGRRGYSQSVEGEGEGEGGKEKKGSDTNWSSYQFGEGGRNVSEVVSRVACLQLVLARWGLEAALRNGSPADRVQSAFDGINQAIQLPNLKPHLTPKERELLLQPLGKWSQTELNETEGLWEEFGVFQWCLGIQKDIPAYFETCHRSQLFVATGMAPGQPTTISDFLTHAPAMVQPRDQDAITDQLTQAEIWHWRSQVQSLLALKDLGNQLFNEVVTDPSEDRPMDEDDEVLDYVNLPVAVRRMIENLPQAIAHTSSLAYARGALLLTTQDDFGIPVEVAYQFGTDPDAQHPDVIPYRQLPEPVHDQLTTVAEARYHALAYLCGSFSDYDDPISRLKEAGGPGSVLGGMPHLWAPENEDPHEGTGNSSKS